MRNENKPRAVNERLEKYLILTKKALHQAEKAKAKGEEANIILDMAQRYYDDALYFQDKGMLLTALCAVTYAHGWLDCGSKLGFFNVHDSNLFVIK